jgi:hypothetical protein
LSQGCSFCLGRSPNGSAWCSPECAKGYARLMPKPGVESHGKASGPSPGYLKAWQLSVQKGRAKRKWLAGHPGQR